MDRAGEAINPNNLSVFENYVLGLGKAYNKQLDREDLYDEQFEAAQAAQEQASFGFSVTDYPGLASYVQHYAP